LTNHEWPVERWRPVAVELPPKGARPVLVTDGKGWAMGRYHRSGWGYYRGWQVYGSEVHGRSVTHWAPLPPRP
jgi:hypothetical protein